MKVRLLHLVIGVSVVTLGLRVDSVVDGLGSAAQAAGKNEAAAAAPRPETEPQPEVDAFAEVPAVEKLPADPFLLSDEEIELLQALSERRDALFERETELDEREALLAAAEKRIEERILALENLQVQIEDLLVKYDEQEERQIKSLVAIYEKMKPKDAARIFQELEMPVLLRVLERMKERLTAPVLAAMSPERAMAVTLELAERRKLPLPRE